MPWQMADDVVDINFLRFRVTTLSWAAIFEFPEAPLVMATTTDPATQTHSTLRHRRKATKL
jgi:hypothetical protein